MNIYITGWRGLLGSALNRFHTLAGDTVYGCDAANGGVDIRHVDQLVTDMRRIPDIDRVYHCAAMLGVQNTESNPHLCNTINVKGTHNVIAACEHLCIKQLVFISSSEVYGRPVDLKPFHERSRLRGDNVYALSKMCSEHAVLSSLIPIVNIVRMFNCYGIHQVKQFFIPKILQQAIDCDPIRLFGTHSSKRSYLYADDAAVHISNVASKAPTKCVVNIAADGGGHTLREVADIVIDLTKSTSTIESLASNTFYDDRLVARDVPLRLADISLLKQYSLHKPQGIRKGIAKTLANADTLKDCWTYSYEE